MDLPQNLPQGRGWLDYLSQHGPEAAEAEGYHFTNYSCGNP